MKYVNIKGTSIRNLDFTHVIHMDVFQCDDELYNFKNGMLPAGISRFKTSKISNINVYAAKSIKLLDLSDNVELAKHYKGIFYKISQ